MRTRVGRAVALETIFVALGVFVPAAVAVWVMLGRYEGYFEDARLFFAMGAGIAAGLVVRFVQVWAFRFEDPYAFANPPTTSSLVYSFAYTALGYALLEGLGKTAVLGFRKFRTRKDSPYYGAALGLAFGAIWATEFATVRFQFPAPGQPPIFAATYDAFLILLAVGMMLASGASGTWIGRGVADGKLWGAAVKGSLWVAPTLALGWLFLNLHDQVLTAIAALAWGAFALAYADIRVLEPIVPPEIRDMVRKQRRREQRGT